MSKNADEPAYPKLVDGVSHGLTKRELIAAMALQGIMSKWAMTEEQAAALAIRQADELLKQLDK